MNPHEISEEEAEKFQRFMKRVVSERGKQMRELIE